MPLYLLPLAAAAIRALVPYAPGEIVFVEHRPFYTLAFYFGVETEQVDLATSDRFHPGPSYRPVSSDLADELAEPEQRRVLLLARSQEEPWLDELAVLGRTSRKAGRVGRFLVYLEPTPALAP